MPSRGVLRRIFAPPQAPAALWEVLQRLVKVMLQIDNLGGMQTQTLSKSIATGIIDQVIREDDSSRTNRRRASVSEPHAMRHSLSTPLPSSLAPPPSSSMRKSASTAAEFLGPHADGPPRGSEEQLKSRTGDLGVAVRANATPAAMDAEVLARPHARTQGGDAVVAVASAAAMRRELETPASAGRKSPELRYGSEEHALHASSRPASGAVGSWDESSPPCSQPGSGRQEERERQSPARLVNEPTHHAGPPERACVALTAQPL